MLAWRPRERFRAVLPDEAVGCDLATLHRIESGFCVIDPSDLQIQPENLHAGQQVRLIISASTLAEIKDGGRVETTEYVGTINAIDANNIVLRDACTCDPREGRANDSDLEPSSLLEPDVHEHVRGEGNPPIASWHYDSSL